MRQDREFNMIEERLSAKVPIVKFRHKISNIEGQIQSVVMATHFYESKLRIVSR